MMKKRLGRRKRLSLTASSLTTSCALLTWLLYVDQSNVCVSAFDSFSSFTFGTQPGGRGPRFSFDGFPGTSGGNVDNEEYYKVCASTIVEVRDKTTQTKVSVFTRFPTRRG